MGTLRHGAILPAVEPVREGRDRDVGLLGGPTGVPS